MRLVAYEHHAQLVVSDALSELTLYLGPTRNYLTKDYQTMLIIESYKLTAAHRQEPHPGRQSSVGGAHGGRKSVERLEPHCCVEGSCASGKDAHMKRHRRVTPLSPPSSAFTGFRFPPEIIVLAVRWYLRFGLSYRDLEELLAERGVAVDYVMVHRWVQRFTPLVINAARPCRHTVGNAGSSTRPTSKSPACGGTCTAPSTDTARSSTSTGTVALTDLLSGGDGVRMKRRRCVAQSTQLSAAFTGFRFPPEVILLAVRWYLRFGLSYRDLEELLGERGVEVDHFTLHRWVQRFTPLLIDAARPFRHAVGRRWFVDETYVKVAGV
jgi:transposase-like protein